MDTPSGAEKTKYPYCGQENLLENEFCWSCYKHMRVPKEARVQSKLDRELKKQASQAVSDGLLTGSMKDESHRPPWLFWGRMTLVGGLFLFYLRWLKTANYHSFLDFVNLAFHEFGHLALGFTGEFIGALSGTLFQLLAPAACFYHFYRRDERLGWQLCLFWLGENFLNVSIYAGDTIRQELPLVVGGVHDCTYLLTATGLIAHTEGVGRFFFGLGTVIIFWSFHLIGSDALARRRLVS